MLDPNSRQETRFGKLKPDFNDNYFSNEVIDIFQPKLEDYCESLENKLYKSLLKHWTEEDNVPSYQHQSSLGTKQPKGILLPYPRLPNQHHVRKNVSFVPGTVFAERNQFSHFWLRIYALRQRRRALRRLNAEAADALTRRRGCTRKHRRFLHRMPKDKNYMNGASAPPAERVILKDNVNTILSNRDQEVNSVEPVSDWRKSIVSGIRNFFGRIHLKCIVRPSALRPESAA